ncbi:MAG: zinc ribbon domain-containing protein [Euryarchaeota archaeon]|nr:zinc ribbon domain-containing protein [Euryarchaeota archaeon]
MKECIECGIMIEDDARFCRICGAFQRPKDMGRDGRRATRPYQTIPVEAPGTRETVLPERTRRQLGRLCILGIVVAVLGITMAAMRIWYGAAYGIFAMVIGSLAVHYRIDYGDACLILGAVCVFISVSLPFLPGT